jgi:hypothetical protein
LLSEIRKIKNEKPVEYILESKKGKPIVKDWDSIEKDWNKKIHDKFENYKTDLRKYVAVYASGGGTNATQYQDGGTMNGDLTIRGGLISDRIYTTQLDALSANITVIDIKQYELSGFNVTGDVTINGSVSAQNISAANLYSNGVQVATVVDPVRTTLTGNGVLSTFAISGAGGLVNPSALIVAIDGALQEPGADYGVSGGNITFTSPLANGSKAVVISPVNTVQVGQVVPSDGSVTSAKIVGGVTLTSPSLVGQVELTSQAASNGTSVMTRDLSDSRYGQKIYSTLSTTSSTVLNNYDTLFTKVLPVGDYRFEYHVFVKNNEVSANINPRIRFSTQSGTVSVDGVRESRYNQGTYVASCFRNASATSHDGGNVTVGTPNFTEGSLKIFGFINVTSQATIQFLFSHNTAAPTNPTTVEGHLVLEYLSAS